MWIKSQDTEVRVTIGDYPAHPFQILCSIEACLASVLFDLIRERLHVWNYFYPGGEFKRGQKQSAGESHFHHIGCPSTFWRRDFGDVNAASLIIQLRAFPPGP